MLIPWETLKKSQNARTFMLLRFIGSMWFVEAVWYFYWGRFLSYTQIGLAFSWLVIVGMIAEIPTGYFADKFGRKASVVIGFMLLGLGGIVCSTAQNGIWLILGTTIMTTGRAFISGALEALVYDDLKKVKEAHNYDRIISLGIQVAFVGFLLAVPLGGFLYTKYFRIPNILETLSGFAGMITALFLREMPTSKDENQKEPSMLVGIKELFVPALRPYIVSAFVCITVFLLYDWGLSKPAMAVNYGLDSRGQSIAYTIFAIINIIAINWLPSLRKWWGDYWGVRILNIIVGLAFVVSTLSLGIWGVLVMAAIEIIGNIGDPWTSSIINDRVGSRYRATTLSSLALLTKVPHLLVNVLAGSAIDGVGINQFHLWLGAIILMITVVATRYKKS